MLLELARPITQQIQPPASPVVYEGVIVCLIHEAIDLDEVEESIATVGCGLVGCHERVIHGRETLLTVQDDIGSAITTLKAVDRLTGECLKVFVFALPKKKATDVVVAEDGTH